MHRIKKLFILQLAVILVFSIITVISSADANIPQGPIDSVDKDNGVDQIMEAGIKDKNFARQYMIPLYQLITSVMKPKM